MPLPLLQGSVEEQIMEVVRKRTEAVAGAAAASPAGGGGGMSSEEEADEYGLGMGHGRGRGRWGYGERTNVRMQASWIGGAARWVAVCVGRVGGRVQGCLQAHSL